MSLLSECNDQMMRLRGDLKRAGRLKDMPQHYWALISPVLTQLAGLSCDERLQVLGKVPKKESEFLFGVAMSAATGSVRRRDPDLISSGLLALIIEDGAFDYRETLMYLCLLVNSARKLGADIDAMYERAQPLATRATGDIIGNYLRSGVKDLSAMGYEEATDADGFTYKRTR